MSVPFPKIFKNGLLRPADVVLWLAASAALFYLVASFWLPAAQAQQFRVLVNNQEVEAGPLGENQQLTISGSLGDSVLEVRDGKVRFVSSPCRNQVCVHQGWASHSGELLACLPNRIAVVLEGLGQSSNVEVDAVNF